MEIKKKRDKGLKKQRRGNLIPRRRGKRKKRLSTEKSEIRP